MPLPSKALLASCLAGLVAACGGNRTQTRPASANLPAAQLATGDTYRHVYPGFATQSALAEEKPDDQGATSLSYLVKGADPVVLAPNALSLTVHVAPAEPASALFLAGGDGNNVGALQFVDLDAKTIAAVAVDHGDKVPAEGFWYGANGKQFLFIGDYDLDHGTGTLYWSDGQNVDPLVLGVPPAAVLFDRARNEALVGAVAASDPACDPASTDPAKACVYDATVDAPVGSLAAVDLKAGAKTVLASDVQLVQTLADANGGTGRDLDFSLSDNGHEAAYVSADGSIFEVATTGGEPKKVGEGSAPALDPVGQGVVYFTKNAAGDGDDLVKNAGGAQTLLVAGVTPATRPQFSSDGYWLVYFQNLVFGGSGSGAVGDAALLLASGDQDPIAIGQRVGWDTVRVDPKRRFVVAVGDLSALGNEASYDGMGSILAGQLGMPPSRAETGTRVGNLVQLDATGGWLGIHDLPSGLGGGTVSLLPPAGTKPTDLGQHVNPLSLRAAHGFDAAVWIADIDKDHVLDGGLYKQGTLYGTAGVKAGTVVENGESGVIQAEFGLDGRVLTLVGSGDKAGIWTLPAPK